MMCMIMLSNGRKPVTIALTKRMLLLMLLLFTHTIDSLQQAADRQFKCSFTALSNDLHALRWALVGNICVSLPAYLLVMLLLTGILQ